MDMHNQAVRDQLGSREHGRKYVMECSRRGAIRNSIVNGEDWSPEVIQTSIERRAVTHLLHEHVESTQFEITTQMSSRGTLRTPIACQLGPTSAVASGQRLRGGGGGSDTYRVRTCTDIQTDLRSKREQSCGWKAKCTTNVYLGSSDFSTKHILWKRHTGFVHVQI